MHRPLIVLAQADQEIISSAEYLETQRSGAGSRFLTLVLDALQRIEANPEIYGAVEGNIRAASIRKFHYVVVYRVLPDYIEVVAVLHGARDSSNWRSRL
jgi:plasmid stabilization system protein ParE